MDGLQVKQNWTPGTIDTGKVNKIKEDAYNKYGYGDENWTKFDKRPEAVYTVEFLVMKLVYEIDTRSSKIVLDLRKIDKSKVWNTITEDTNKNDGEDGRKWRQDKAL